MDLHYQQKDTWSSCRPDWLPILLESICTTTSSITVFSGVGISEESQALLKLYPNPADNLITVEAEGMIQAKIISLDGKLIKEASSKDFFTFDVTELNPSIYLMEVLFKNGNSIVKRFVVE